MKWHFIPQLACYVETGVTQRDQFRNDEVELYDTIVREAVQNSLDATPNGETTKVVFRWVSFNDGLDPKYVKDLLENQLDHAKSSGIEVANIDFEQPAALIIEDYGTSGLTGSTDSKDEDNFSDFWRRHGKSHKTGTNRGRWGLGKLVYSSSSVVCAFFGVTIRNSDPNRYLMGQTVLDLRTHEGKEYPPHAYFSEMVGEEIHEKVPLPINDTDFIEYFSEQFGISRVDEPGLSIVIPFPDNTLQPEKMIEVAIVNYFYPIITEQLTLFFNDLEINKENIRKLAHEYAKSRIHDIDPLFDFIEQTNRCIQNNDLLSLKPSWINDTKLAEDDFDQDILENVRESFASKKTVGVWLPLTIKTKPEKEIFDTGIYVFVQRPDDLSKGVDLYVRGGLTLPAESKFGERKAFGAMIANDFAISAFLGDAENPAHTKWVFNAEKLRKNYVAPGDKLRAIKNAVINFYDLLVQAEEDEDEKALSKFFFTEEPEDPGPKNKKPRKTPKPDIEPPTAKPRVARLATIENGFSVRKGKNADDAAYPILFRVHAAYDTASGNPFKKYNPMDFDFMANSGPDIALTKDSVSLKKKKANMLEFEVTDAAFQINVTGFDPNRDLLVKLQTEAIEGE